MSDLRWLAFETMRQAMNLFPAPYGPSRVTVTCGPTEETVSYSRGGAPFVLNASAIPFATAADRQAARSAVRWALAEHYGLD